MMACESGRRCATTGSRYIQRPAIVNKFPLPWRRLVWLRDAYPMIGEFRVHAAQLNFRHVAGRAFVPADGASRRITSLSLRFLHGGQVTRQTLRVVIRRF